MDYVRTAPPTPGILDFQACFIERFDEAEDGKNRTVTIVFKTVIGTVYESVSELNDAAGRRVLEMLEANKKGEIFPRIIVDTAADEPKGMSFTVTHARKTKVESTSEHLFLFSKVSRA